MITGTVFLQQSLKNLTLTCLHFLVVHRSNTCSTVESLSCNTSSETHTFLILINVHVWTLLPVLCPISAKVAQNIRLLVLWPQYWYGVRTLVQTGERGGGKGVAEGRGAQLGGEAVWWNSRRFVRTGMKQERRGEEETRTDDKGKSCGSLQLRPKGSHLSSPPLTHLARGQTLALQRGSITSVTARAEVSAVAGAADSS